MQVLDFSLLPMENESINEVLNRLRFSEYGRLDVAKTCIYYYAVRQIISNESAAVDFLKGPRLSGDFAMKALKAFANGFDGFRMTVDDVTKKTFESGVCFNEIPLEMMIFQLFPNLENADEIYTLITTND